MTARADDDPGVRADDNPGVIAQPPYIFLCFLALGFGLNAAWPLGLGLAGAQVPGGVAVLALGLLMATLAPREFARAGTSYQTRDPASALILRGLYRHSRNPVYVAFCLAPIGIGILVNSFWILISFIPSALLVYFIAIRKEEAYLEKKFGEEYIHYKQKVRRWL